MDLVKGFREVHHQDICLLTGFKIASDVICEFQQLGFTGSALAEAMLKWIQDVVFFTMPHDVTGDNVF